jgi:hypothetical protein
VGLHIGEICKREPVWSEGREVTVNEVCWSKKLVIMSSRDFEGPPPSCPGESHVAHEPLNGAASDTNAVLVEGDPDLAGAIDKVVLVVGGLDLFDQDLVSNCSFGLRP